MSACPCGSGLALDDCCGRFLSGGEAPPTAAELMRARYTAHTLVDLDFIEGTHDPESREDIDREATARWARRAEWLGLEIVAAEAGGAADARGTVEFVAHFRERGERRRHHEVARFRRGGDGHWLYVDGEAPEAGTVRRQQPRVGRNAPCPCGSGRKYKKCCGAGAP